MALLRAVTSSKIAAILRTFARKSSNIDFFIKLLLQLGYELLLSEMQKKNGGVTDFVSEIRYLKGHPNFKKIGLYPKKSRAHRPSKRVNSKQS